jgi:glycosyltransferase involved in cell wall biosynthesis
VTKRLSILALNWRDLRHPDAGGAEINISRQARHWVQQGHQVTLICADPGRTFAPTRDEVIDGIRVLRMGNRFSVYLLALLYYWRHVTMFDCIVDVSNGIPFFAPLLAHAPGLLLVHHVHGKQWFIEMPHPLSDLGWFLERKVVPAVYRRWPVIAVSPTTRDALLELGFAPSQVTVVYNGVDLPAELPKRRHDGVPRNAYVGRLKRYKRLELLIRAVAELRHKYPTIHLDIAGDGDAKDDIEALVNELSLQDHVTLYGYVDEKTKAEILARADVFATPSTQEGWGLSVIEANAFGCPAVAFNVPGLSVAVRDGETGLLANSEAAFTAALGKILGDAETRSCLSAGALAWAAMFRWENTAASTLQVMTDTWNLP